MKNPVLSYPLLFVCCLVLLFFSFPCNAADITQDVVPYLNESSVPHISIAPLNPAFVQYQDELEQNQNPAYVDTNTFTTSVLLLSDTVNVSSLNLLNGLSPLDEGEFVHPTGLIPSPVDLSHLSPVNMQELMASEEYGLMSSDIRLTDVEAYPSRYDLRDVNGVTDVRDQGQAGSCWAHSTIASLESYLLHNRFEIWDFSENNVKNTMVYSSQDGFDRTHDNGGNNLITAAYLTRWDGPIAESDDPYNDLSGVSPSNNTVAKHVQEIQILPGVNHSDNLFKLIITNSGAISVSMWSDNSYFNSENNTYYYYDEARGTNHAVTLVGWDDNFDRHNFTPAAPGNGAFIVKNSWGTNWGEDGYFYISYYDNATGFDIGLFGLGTKPYARNFLFTAENVSNYDHIYQYDPLGWCYYFGYNNSTAYGANVFTATTNETLEAVSFYTVDSNSFYNISVYMDPESGPVNSSGPISLKNGTIPLAGYHTIDLDNNVLLRTGQNFSVVVEFTTPNYNYPIAIEAPISGYSSNAHAEPGQSYISHNGTEWEDINVYDANVCIKAFTTEEKEPEAAFVAGTKYVHVNESVDFHDASLFSPTIWEWDFGDNSTSSAQNPLHTYANTGVYNVSLNVTNSAGSNTSVSASFIHVLNSTIVVNGSGSADFATIREAIGAVSDGDTIVIEPGTYTENLYLKTEHISLISSTGNPADVRIVSADSDDIIIYVVADNVTISGVTAADGYIGIVSTSSGCNISNCYASGNLFGLYLYNSQDTIVSNCTLSENEYGLRLRNSVNNILNNNSMENNTYNSYFDSNPNVVGMSNLVEGKPIYYLVDSSDQVINASTNAGLVHLINCSNVTVEDLEIENNYYGLSLYDSNNVTISNCTSTENKYGLYFDSSVNSTVHSCNISDILSYGILLKDCNDNLIYNNYFNSSNNVYVSGDGSNDWNISMIAGINIINGTYVGGNFWATPSGTGWSETHYSIGNGFCQPYELRNDVNNTDFLPLTSNDEQPEEVVASRSQNGNDGIHVRIPTSTSSPSNIAAMDSSVRFVGRDAEIQYVFTDGSTPVTDISFEADTNVGYVMATVNLLNDLPENAPVSTSFRVYQIMDIVLGGDAFSSGVGEATIGFSVSKEWLGSNGFDESDIHMEHFSEGEWNRLPTVVTGEDEDNFHFEAITTGFSPFIICADVPGEEPVNAGSSMSNIDDGTFPSSTESEVSAGSEDDSFNLTLVLSVLVLIGVLGSVYWMKKSK
jgi:PGF-pre-PGF domain-containing protein